MSPGGAQRAIHQGKLSDGTHNWSCQEPEPDAHRLRGSQDTGLCAASHLSIYWTLTSPAAPVPLDATCSHCRTSHRVSSPGSVAHLPPPTPTPGNDPLVNISLRACHGWGGGSNAQAAADGLPVEN